MNSSPRKRRLLLVGLLVVVAAAGGGAAYILWPRLPAPGSPRYVAYVRNFHVGVAALESPKTFHLALEKLNAAIDLVPQEPAAWANRGLLHLRLADLPSATRDLQQAKTLAPESGAIDALLGELARRQGKLPDAVAHMKKAVASDPRNLQLVFVLAQMLSEMGEEADAELQQLMDGVLAQQPNNLRALAIRAQTAYARHDQAVFHDSLARLRRLAPQWSDSSRKQLSYLYLALYYAPVQAASTIGIRSTPLGTGPLLAASTLVAEASQIRMDAPQQLARVHNSLRGERGYRRGVGNLREDAQDGTVIHHFLRLQQPQPTPAAPDRALAFAVKPWTSKTFAELEKTRCDVLRLQWRIREPKLPSVADAALKGGIAAPPAKEFDPAVWLATGRTVRRADVAAPAQAFPGGSKAVAPAPAGVTVLDWNNDLRTDMLLAGAGGLRFLQAGPDDSFTDITAKTGLPTAVINDDYYGAWAADLEMDGDLDIVLARRSGAPVVLRNNGDGTFKVLDIPEFAALRDIRAFVWADLDNDGASDAIFLDAAGTLHIFANERFNQFTAWPLPKDIGAVLAVTAADVTDDGVFDLVVLRKDGMLRRISDVDHRESWQTADLAQATAPTDASVGPINLFVEDLDNNGALDILVAGTDAAQVFLADEQFHYAALPGSVPLRVFAVIDLDGDGRLDLLGLSADGQPVKAVNSGAKTYQWQDLRPLANPKSSGDNRNNSFAIGGELEARAGLLVQKHRITGPMVHVGLGEQTDIDVIRIVWPSGEPQWEFTLPPPLQCLLAAQRLNSSCPFLFTYDGTGMRFGGDFMWATPLGMYVNGQNINSFAQTTEWLKIPGAHLVAKDGHYDVRVHANLWETDYFDQLALLVVDHPPDTEIHVDERFFLTPTPPELYVTTPARPVAQAWDHFGQDATDLVRAIDGRYLDRAGRGKYQGITADHWVEADLGDDAPTEGPIYLIARGWIHPTDSSINVAVAQGNHARPQPVTLEVPDGKGGWKVGRPALGFPAGKDKSMLIRLDGIDGPGVSRRFRLRTNLEIYWDFLGYARRLDSKLARIERPNAAKAELRYRGLLEMTQKDASSPEVPHYDKVMRGRQLWRDLTGYYTRYGDVRELVTKADDRYVIANAGDEIALRFPAPADPPAGWRRDFIWESDGWTRDGNPNTRFGTTVLPLPAHGVNGLDQPPGRLEDDPVVRRFPQDWLTYHTRYVTSEDFERGLRTFRKR